MQRQNALMVSVFIFALTSSLACGPKCPDIKSTLTKKELVKDDAARLNQMVDRRQSLISGETQNTATFALDRMKFSVTAFELAIQIQLRIMNLADGSELYEKNSDTITETRCFLDEILEKPVNLLSDRVGKGIHKRHALFQKLFAKDGEPSKYELKDIYETGIAVDEAPSSKDGEDAFGDEEPDDEAEASPEKTKPKKKQKKKEKEEDLDLDLF